MFHVRSRSGIRVVVATAAAALVLASSTTAFSEPNKPRGGGRHGRGRGTIFPHTPPGQAKKAIEAEPPAEVGNDRGGTLPGHGGAPSMDLDRGESDLSDSPSGTDSTEGRSNLGGIGPLTTGNDPVRAYRTPSVRTTSFLANSAPRRERSHRGWISVSPDDDGGVLGEAGFSFRFR